MERERLTVFSAMVQGATATIRTPRIARIVVVVENKHAPYVAEAVRNKICREEEKDNTY